MGKRKRSDNDYDYISKKIKQLEREIVRARKRKQHHRDSSPSSSSTSSSSSSRSGSTSSSSSSSSAAPRPRATHAPRSMQPLYLEDVSRIAREPVPLAGVAADPQPSTSAATDPQPSTSTATDPWPATIESQPLPCNEVTVDGSLPLPQELDQQVLEIMGADPSQKIVYGKDIQADLAVRLQHITSAGLTKEMRKELQDRYLLPANCTLINAPILNPEVKAAMSENVLKRDQGIEHKQKQLSSAITSIAEAFTIALSYKNTELIKLLMDANKILCDVQYSDSMIRRNFILYNLKKELKDQLLETKIDKFLFSQNLAETLKTAKAISKSGEDMKITPPKPIINSKKTNKPMLHKNLNWRGPAQSHRQKGPQRTKEPVRKTRPDNSSKQSSRPALRSRRQ